jgi:hypothetical protein
MAGMRGSAVLANVVHGIYGGLLGGLAFGMVMGLMGMLPTVGRMIGQPTIGAGFLLHMAISAVVGAGFGLTLGRFDKGADSGVALGLAYGLIWWILGPLTLMPLFLGMGIGVSWNAQAAADSLPSLAGHLVYGGVLGIAYSVFRSEGKRARAREAA